MPEDYTAKQGDCMNSIAFTRGFFWETLWNHPDNAELKRTRKNPDVLREGDVVHIPDLTLREESGATEARHRFKLKGVPAKLRLKLVQPKEPPEEAAAEDAAGDGSDESTYADPDPQEQAAETEPMANVPYVLYIDGTASEGQTDGEGKVEITIPPHAREGKLTLRPPDKPEQVIPLNLGGMDPVDTVSGARLRLINLGYRCAPEGETIDAELKDLLMRFQHDQGLKTSGELDKDTQDKLKQAHGS